MFTSKNPICKIKLSDKPLILGVEGCWLVWFCRPDLKRHQP